jgi:RNA-directed DNA polymerase
MSNEIGELPPGGPDRAKGGTWNMEPEMGNMTEPKFRDDVSTKQLRIAELAKQHAGEALNNVQRFIDGPWLLEAYHRIRKDGAPGIDGQTWEMYGENLHKNLLDLLGRIKNQQYKAPPVRRVHIPKGTGNETRPIGIPTIEDRIVQKAVAMVLEPILEGEFLDGSYGYRPKRSAHQGLARIRQGAEEEGTQWIVEVDLRKFFDTLDHQKLRQMLRQRISDGIITRLIDIWLKAGVMENGCWSASEEGTPQGGVISPLLANLYLHEALDLWLTHIIPQHMTGRHFWVRFADDFIIGCETKEDARMLRKALETRLGKYGLCIHPDKTRIIPFGRPVTRHGKMRDGNTPEEFDFLGFTHQWHLTEQGYWRMCRRTAAKRYTRALKNMNEWMKKNRHQPTKEQHASIKAKIRGHCAYYGIAGNLRRLKNFAYETTCLWRKWLNRRGGKKSITWEKYWEGINAYFPMPKIRIVHPKC